MRRAAAASSEPEPSLSTADQQRIRRKLQEISDNQEKLRQTLETIQQELAIVKVRATK